MKAPAIKIQGHSGCQVTVLEEDGHAYIAKKTNDADYAPRLKNQYLKHRAFMDAFKTIKAPELFGYCDTPSSYSYYMEYLTGQDCISFFETCNAKQLRTFTDNLMRYLTESLSLSVNSPFPQDAVKEKLASIQSHIALLANPTFDQATRALTELVPSLSDTPLLQGMHHGDLTFSNMIISLDGAIAVFDFLDSFIDSPLLDIAKLRQDSIYEWILHKHITSDPQRVRTCFSVMNESLDAFVAEQKIPLAQVHFFELLSLLRIIPYTKETATLRFLTEQIKRSPLL